MSGMGLFWLLIGGIIFMPAGFYLGCAHVRELNRRKKP